MSSIIPKDSQLEKAVEDYIWGKQSSRIKLERNKLKEEARIKAQREQHLKKILVASDLNSQAFDSGIAS